jgi:hypothetical protein
MDYQGTVSHGSLESTPLHVVPNYRPTATSLHSCSVRTWIDRHKFWGNPTNVSRDTGEKLHCSLTKSASITDPQKPNLCSLLWMWSYGSSGKWLQWKPREHAICLVKRLSLTDLCEEYTSYQRNVYKLHFKFSHKVQFSEMFCPFSLMCTVLYSFQESINVTEMNGFIL